MARFLRGPVGTAHARLAMPGAPSAIPAGRGKTGFPVPPGVPPERIATMANKLPTDFRASECNWNAKREGFDIFVPVNPPVMSASGKSINMGGLQAPATSYAPHLPKLALNINVYAQVKQVGSGFIELAKQNAKERMTAKAEGAGAASPAAKFDI